MKNTMHTYVGFGFGAIQPGLLLYEAFRSRAFNRYVVAEILPELVKAVTDADGCYTLNMAGMDGVRQMRLGPVELLDVGKENHRQKLIEAIAGAHEIGTAITTFNQYVMDIPGSLHLMLAEGIIRKTTNDQPSAVIYCAENNNHAAELLQEVVMPEIPANLRDAVQEKVQFVNTVVSKMCGLVTDSEVIQTNHLSLMWRDSEVKRALLVEDYDLLLINRIHLPRYRRGISIFEEKDDLLPFKEAKLFGHNGTHAIAAYIGGFTGLNRITQMRDRPVMMAFLRKAFLEEVGTALCRKYSGFDPLFTPGGFSEFVDSILLRMVNPYLLDTVARVGRDPRRKLGWEDRLVGAIRLALDFDVKPARYAFGAAAALASMDESIIQKPKSVSESLLTIWHPEDTGVPPTREEYAVLAEITEGMSRFLSWRDSGYTDSFLW
ncbi:MAG: hypothetical protein P1S60_02365 [Anaerolineae bacterium]|nr:hypothetical protein [Anaerolineae bacterium]